MKWLKLSFVFFGLVTLAGCSETPKPTETQSVTLASLPAITPTSQPMPTPDNPVFDEEAIEALNQLDKTGYVKRTVEGKCLQLNQGIDDCFWTVVVHGSSIFVVAGHSVLEHDGDVCSWNGSLFRFRRSDLKTDYLSLGELRNEGPTAFSSTAIDGRFVVVGDSGTVLVVDPDRLSITRSVSILPKIKAGEAVVDSVLFTHNGVGLRGGINTDDNDPVSFRAYPSGATWSATMNLKTWKVTDCGVFKRTI